MQREYPDSLFFLEPALADATIAQNEQSRVLETFLTNPSADEVDIVVQNVSLSELAKPPYKASVSFQKLLYAPGHPAGTRAPDVHRANRFLAARPCAERVHSRESARSSGQLFPRRSGVRGGQAMIANVAFLARADHLPRGRLAGGRAVLSGAVQGRDLPTSRTDDRVGDPGALSELVRRVLRHRSTALPPRHRPEAVAHGPATRVARCRPPRPPSGLEGVGVAACGVTSIPVRTSASDPN